VSSDFNQSCYTLQEPTTNGEIHKSPSKIPKKHAGGVTPPVKSPVKTSAKPKTPDTAATAAQSEKKSECFPQFILPEKHENNMLSCHNVMLKYMTISKIIVELLLPFISEYFIFPSLI
jgi:hypothetical protein